MVFKTLYPLPFAPFGNLVLVCDAAQNLTGLYFEWQDSASGKMEFNDALEVFVKIKQWLDGYFSGQNPSTKELPLKLSGSAFRLEVWEILRTIPYGETISYGDIAQKIAKKRGLKKMSAQAVGGAVGANPLAILIPCHRVVGKNGNLVGYAGGIEMKKKLLCHESKFRRNQ